MEDQQKINEQRRKSSTTSTLVARPTEKDHSKPYNQNLNDDCSEHSSISFIQQNMNSHNSNTCRKCQYSYSIPFMGTLKRFQCSIVQRIKKKTATSENTNTTKARSANETDARMALSGDSNIISKTSEDEEKSGYFQITPEEKPKISAQGRMIAILMISFGTLIAIVFVLIALGKSAKTNGSYWRSRSKERNLPPGTKSSSVANTWTSSTLVTNTASTSTADTVTKLIIVNNASILSKLVTESGITVTISPTPV
ncbi:hypothetical protein BY458DRAFT_554096 [Sporodiniella umbellata]|nr:hypothetical protein BY458DRAFT_554096 [Sporodiniella umbellata]